MHDAESDAGHFEEACRLRRELHEIPELGHKEVATSAFVEQYLRGLLNCEVFRPAENSVCARFGSGNSPLVVRSDLDALPLQDQTGRTEVVHACGHDGHAATLLAIARWCAQRPPGSLDVLLVFQQAEETFPSGAPLVIKGISNRFVPSGVYGFHLWPELEVGTIGLKTGPLMAAVDGFTISTRSQVRGPTHGENAEAEVSDALRHLADIYLAIRGSTRGRDLRVSAWTVQVGQLQGGHRPNAVPLAAELRGTVRSIDEESREQAFRMIRERTEAGACEDVATTIEFQKNIRPHLCNDHGAIDQLLEAAAVSGVRAIEYPNAVLGISEDFGWYQKLAAGAYMLVGCTAPGAAPRHLHSHDFEFDERALGVAFRTIRALISQQQA